jgi:membrane protein implicated in regulation of membrane protease activity
MTRALSKIHGLHVELKEESLIEAILGIFNPLSIATFLTFFGLAGAIASISLHLPEIFSIPIAIFAGWVAVQVVVHSIAWLFENLGSSTEAKVADFVGRMAEVTIPIDVGKVGEVIYIINAKRYASAAKSIDPTVSFSKRSKVMIAEVRDHLIMVEPWTDSFIDPDFDSPKLH